MSPGHFPHGAIVRLPGGGAGPVARLVLVPDLDLLVAGAGRHPLAVKVIGDIVNEVLVVNIDALRHI